MADNKKDYSSISPSAAFLIQLKAYTTISFANEAAALLEKENEGMAQYIRQTGIKQFFKWLVHFENRYRSIEKIVSGLHDKNILELSSGYSFRGMDICRDKDIHFIDTDLPELIATKQKMVEAIMAQMPSPLKGILEIMPLNVLDEKSFSATINKFTSGPITIINEGLLMYLNYEEKKKTCTIIHDILKQRGGQWVTADAYIKRKKGQEDILDTNENVKIFREQHHIEENKFDDFATAASFFASCGFKIIHREVWATDELSCLQVLPKPERDEVIEKLKSSSHENETWCMIAE